MTWARLIVVGVACVGGVLTEEEVGFLVAFLEVLSASGERKMPAEK